MGRLETGIRGKSPCLLVGPDGFEKAVESNLESFDRPGNMLQFAGLALETLADCVEEWLKKERKL